MAKDISINLSRRSLKKAFPNALAILRVDLSNDTMHLVEDFSKKDTSMRSKKNSSRSNASSKDAPKQDPAVEQIWDFMGQGKIDISYACIGYTMDGKPVLDYDNFISLLVNLGFSIGPVLDFIDDFNRHSQGQDTAPVIMISSNSSRIMADIEDIVDDGQSK